MLILIFQLLYKVLKVHCDNQAAKHLTKNQMFYERSKHIDIKLHFVRDILSKGNVVMEKVHTSENLADMLTKPVVLSKFKHCLNLIQVIEN